MFNATRTFLDLGTSHAFIPHCVADCNAKNLLNTPRAFCQGTSSRPIQRESCNQTFQFGVRFDE